MKKTILVSLLIVLVLVFSGCTNNKKNNQTIKVASHMTPMTDVIKLAGEELKKEGYRLELVQVNDNVQYNELLKNKEVDANFAQHEPYMKKYNSQKKANLVAVQKIYNAKVGFYSKKYKSITDIPNGAKVALPNDVSNEGRALAILAEQGLIKLKKGVGFNGTSKDVIDNPKDLKWLFVDLLNLSETYNESDVALVYNYPTYIAKIGLKPSDAIFLEKNIDERFAISLVTRNDNQNTKKIEALRKAMTSDRVRKYLIVNNKDTLLPAF